MRIIAKTVCPSKLKSLAALDPICEVHGRQNFKKMRELILVIALTVESHEQIQHTCDELIAQSLTVEDYAKSRTGLWSPDHFYGGACGNHSADHGPASHCSWYTFSAQDPGVPLPYAAGSSECGHMHQRSCVPCEKLVAFPAAVARFATAVTAAHTAARPAGERVEELAALARWQDAHSDLLELTGETRLGYYLARYDHYIGHQVRLANEKVAFEKKLAKLKERPECLGVTMDWAMRYNPKKYRESMGDFFGKKGVSWHGVWIYWWSTADMEYKSYFQHQIPENTAKEGAEEVCQLAAVALQEHMTAVGTAVEHTTPLFDSDGAGCYNGIGLAAR
ncbi:hypothetical protein B484DRAFT_439723 [Ochromonadaceae sp. CCMP2298]|nr:hypothetical protein B484DRAFT_439723 [Ochromonadaceae sp. CCMP2298]